MGDTNDCGIQVYGSFHDYCQRCLLTRPYCETLFGDNGSKHIIVKCEDEERCEWLRRTVCAGTADAGKE